MPIRGLRKFEQQIRHFSKTLMPQQVVLFQKRVAFDLLSRLVLKTPVDTGRARGNWQLTVGAPAAGEVGGFEKSGGGFDSAPPLGVIGSGTVSAGAGQLESLPPFVVVFITNNVSYILPLNNGTSKQAGKGWIELSLAEVTEQFP